MSSFIYYLLLVGVDLPEIFDTAYIRAGPIGDRVSIESLETIIGLGGLGPRLYEQVGKRLIFDKKERERERKRKKEK